MAAGFHRLLAAEVTSNFGSMLSRLAIPWLAALTLDASPWQMSALLLADVAAGALGAWLLGVWVDRWPKRRVMWGCDALRAGVLGALAYAASADALSMPWLVAAAAVSGALTMAFELARSAWMAQTIATQQLPKRNAQLAVGGSLSETAAFAIGGWLFQGLGAALALAVDALSYVASALCLRGLREPPIATKPAQQGDAPSTPSGPASARSTPMLRVVVRDLRQDLGQDLREGLRSIARSPLLLRLAALEVLLAAASALFAVAYLVYLSRELHIAVGVQGMVFATGGLGAVLGGALAVRAGARWGSRRALACGLLLAAAGAACVPLAGNVGVSGGFSGATLALVLLVLHQVVGDGGMTMAQVHDRSLRQSQVAAHQLALVDGALRGLGQFATVAAALAAAALAEHWGNQVALACAATLLLVAALVAVWSARSSPEPKDR